MPLTAARPADRGVRAAIMARCVASVAVAVVLLAAAPAAAVRQALVAEEVAFPGAGGVILRGTVLAPAPAPAPAAGRPALALVHGSGEGQREGLRPLAEAFARGGIVTLIYDKRTEGYSLSERDYALLAADARAAAMALRRRDGVDPGRVGLFGVSEGGWVAPLAASTAVDVAFLIVVAANGGPPAEQEQWHRANRLAHRGVSGSLARAYSVTVMRQLVGNGLFPEADYDPLPALRALRQPVLAIWEDDRLTPPAESLATFRAVFESTGHTNYTLRVIPGADHRLHRAVDGGFARGDELAPGFVALVTAWVDGLRAGPPAASADAPPAQERPTLRLAPLAWWEAGWLQLAALGLFLVAFAAYPLAALARRARGLRRAPVVRPARWLAATGALAALGAVGYLAVLLVNAAQQVGPVVAGRPVPWLLLQALAVAAAISLVLTVRSGWRDRDRLPVGERARVGLLVVGGAAFVPWALYWGLLLP